MPVPLSRLEAALWSVRLIVVDAQPRQLIERGCLVDLAEQPLAHLTRRLSANRPSARTSAATGPRTAPGVRRYRARPGQRSWPGSTSRCTSRSSPARSRRSACCARRPSPGLRSRRHSPPSPGLQPPYLRHEWPPAVRPFTHDDVSRSARLRTVLGWPVRIAPAAGATCGARSRCTAPRRRARAGRPAPSTPPAGSRTGCSRLTRAWARCCTARTGCGSAWPRITYWHRGVRPAQPRPSRADKATREVHASG